MALTRKIVLFFCIGLFSIYKISAQVKCTTYACYLCQWGGEFKVETPNVFTPNGDGVNDYWFPTVTNQPCLSDYHVMIFNRWGKLLFETTVYSIAWNGNEVVDGNHCPEGIYFYTLSYSSSYTREAKTLKGYIQLVR